jgi:hypothetical protein
MARDVISCWIPAVICFLFPGFAAWPSVLADFPLGIPQVHAPVSTSGFGFAAQGFFISRSASAKTVPWLHFLSPPIFLSPPFSSGADGSSTSFCYRRSGVEPRQTPFMGPNFIFPSSSCDLSSLLKCLCPARVLWSPLFISSPASSQPPLVLTCGSARFWLLFISFVFLDLVTVLVGGNQSCS